MLGWGPPNGARIAIGRTLGSLRETNCPNEYDQSAARPTNQPYSHFVSPLPLCPSPTYITHTSESESERQKVNGGAFIVAINEACLATPLPIKIYAL